VVLLHRERPFYIDLSATCLYAVTGALLAIRRHYDVVGLFVLALVSGVGGGLICDSIFIQRGPPLAMSDGRYLFVVILGCIGAALLAIGCSFVFRTLAIVFNWKTVSVSPKLA
jgi:uncharacterized membrane protein YeiH